MDFEYCVLDDYLKIAKPVESYNLSQDCLSKLKELGITRVGEVLACSDYTIEDYGENAKWMEEAKLCFEIYCGELDIWELLENDDLLEQEKYEEFSAIDEDDPLGIMRCIIIGTIENFMADHLNNKKAGLKLSESNLSKNIQDMLGNKEDALIPFLLLSDNSLREFSPASDDVVPLDHDIIQKVRAYLITLLSLPQDIFELLDEVDNKILANLREIKGAT